MNNVEFKVNKDVFDFISNYGFEKNIILNPQDEQLNSFRNNPSEKTSKRSNKLIKSLISRVSLQTSILNIAVFLEENQLIFRSLFYIFLLGLTKE